MGGRQAFAFDHLDRPRRRHDLLPGSENGQDSAPMGRREGGEDWTSSSPSPTAPWREIRQEHDVRVWSESGWSA